MPRILCNNFIHNGEPRGASVLRSTVYSYLLLALYLCSAVNADFALNINSDGRIFSSALGKSQAKVDLKNNRLEVTGLKNYSIALDKEFLEIGDFYLSEDGNTIAWLLKRSYPRTDSAKVFSRRTALAIYDHGKKIFQFQAAEIFGKRLNLVQSSTSHTHWLRSMKMDFPGRTIDIETKSFRKIRIAMDSGEVLENVDDETWSSAAAIIEGKIDCQANLKTASWQCHADIERWWKGKGPRRISIDWPDLKKPTGAGGVFNAPQNLFILKSPKPAAWSIEKTLDR